LLDKQGVSMDMWTSPHNARLAHIPTPPSRTYPQEFAFGLTRFACQQPLKMNSRKYLKPRKAIFTQPSVRGAKVDSHEQFAKSGENQAKVKKTEKRCKDSFLVQTHSQCGFQGF